LLGSLLRRGVIAFANAVVSKFAPNPQTILGPGSATSLKFAIRDEAIGVPPTMLLPKASSVIGLCEVGEIEGPVNAS